MGGGLGGIDGRGRSPGRILRLHRSGSRRSLRGRLPQWNHLDGDLLLSRLFSDLLRRRLLRLGLLGRLALITLFKSDGSVRSDRSVRFQDLRRPGLALNRLIHLESAAAAARGLALRAEIEGEDLADVRVDIEVFDRLVGRGHLLGGGSLPHVRAVGLPLAAQLAGGDQGVEVGLEIEAHQGDALRFGAEAVELGRDGPVPPAAGLVAQGPEAGGEPLLGLPHAPELPDLGRAEIAALPVAQPLAAIGGPQHPVGRGSDADSLRHPGIAHAGMGPGHA